jgi:hypothetical protein
VIVKTYLGMRFQQAILAKLAEVSGLPLAPAGPSEEARGIDGFLGNQPVFIKPKSYAQAPAHHEILPARLVVYEKTKDGIAVEFDPWWESHPTQ